MKVKLDFSEAAEQSAIIPKRVKEGDYLAVIKTIDVAPSKQGNEQLVVVLVSPDIRGAAYPYYCPTSGKGAWKTRQLLEAVGKKVPKTVAMLDTSTLVGKKLGMELTNDEWVKEDGEVVEKSTITAIFPEDEIGTVEEADAGEAEAEEVEEDGLEEFAQKKPTAKKASPKAKPAAVDEDELDDEDIDLDEI